MKFTWGHGVTIGFVAFAIYILSFVYRSFQENIDLVAEDYYAQEIAFQDRIDERANAIEFKDEITVNTTGEGILIGFSKDAASSVEIGEVHFFRPSDKSKDLRLPLQLSESNSMLVPTQLLSSGRYTINIQWKGDAAYYISKEIVI